MPGYLESTVAQKIRDFLDDLDAAPPPTASAHEALNLLVSRVRSRRDDRDLRESLRSLLADLDDADAARLPAPQCETLDAEALADELAALLAPPAPVSLKSKPRPTAAMIAAAVALCGAMAAGGCGKPTELKPRPVEDCAADLSCEHFEGLLDKIGLGISEIRAVEKEFATMAATGNDRQQEDLVAQLCAHPKEPRTLIRAKYCVADLGLDHFKTFLEQADDVTPEQRETAEKCLGPAGRQWVRADVVESLCAMPPEAIGQYIKEMFGNDCAIWKTRELQQNEQWPARTVDCNKDMSATHFDHVAQSANAFSWDEIKLAEAGYRALYRKNQELVMSGLCGMSACQIAHQIRIMIEYYRPGPQFGVIQFAVERTFDADAVMYKGVEF